MRYAKGVMWLDDCRIPFVDVNENTIRKTTRCGLFNMTDIDERINGNTQGRFTPNLLVCDDMLNDGVITKQSKRYYNVGTGGQGFYGVKSNGIPQQGDSGSSSRYYDLDKWFDKVIDEIQ